MKYSIEIKKVKEFENIFDAKVWDNYQSLLDFIKPVLKVLTNGSKVDVLVTTEESGKCIVWFNLKYGVTLYILQTKDDDLIYQFSACIRSKKLISKGSTLDKALDSFFWTLESYYFREKEENEKRLIEIGKYIDLAESCSL